MDNINRRLDDLEKRVADLEAQSQQQGPTPLSLMKTALKEVLCSAEEVQDV